MACKARQVPRRGARGGLVVDSLFFQAGDGIRDLTVTGVQTCALPISTRAVFSRRLRDLVELAEARGKIAALTETGVEAVPDSLWWAGTLLAGIKSDSVARRIAWVLVWRNATFEREHRYHFFAPYAGQASAADFVRFTEDPLVLLENELPDMYRLERP